MLFAFELRVPFAFVSIVYNSLLSSEAQLDVSFILLTEASKVFPVYQAIDQSRLVPLLVKTILELEARVTTLEG